MHKLSTHENQLTQAKTFVERVCQHGHAGQVAQLLQTMLNQLNKLCMGLIMPDVPVNTEFKTDATAFTAAVKGTFGYFAREKSGMVIFIFCCCKIMFTNKFNYLAVYIHLYTFFFFRLQHILPLSRNSSILFPVFII